MLCLKSQADTDTELMSQKLLYDNMHVLTLLQIKNETQKSAVETYYQKAHDTFRRLLHSIDSSIKVEKEEEKASQSTEEDKVKLLQHFADTGPIKGSFSNVLDMLSDLNKQAQHLKDTTTKSE